MTNTTKLKCHKRTPTFTKDKDNKDIALVPLADQKGPVKVLKEDFDQLVSRGYSDQWVLSKSGRGRTYIRVRSPHVAGGNALVSRLITGARCGQVVRYLDGNKLNLRADNLIVKNDGASGQTSIHTNTH